MDTSEINDTLMDTDDKNIHEVYNGNMSEHYYEILKVSTWLIVTIGLVLTPVAIFAVSSLVKKDNIAPIYVINLLVSDIIQLCAMILMQTEHETVFDIGAFMFDFALMVSVGFMLCIALERYLVIVWPLWYRTRRTVKMSLLLCAVVWTLALLFLILHLVSTQNHDYDSSFTISGIFLLLPFPLLIFFLLLCAVVWTLALLVLVLVPNILLGFSLIFVFLLLPFPLLIFFLVGTLRALSASISVHAEEKRRIVGLLVLVLLIYTLLFLPGIICYLVHSDFKVHFVACFFSELNPVADLFLYIFLRKGAVNQVWFCVCCCRKNRTIRQSSSGLNDGDTVTSL